MRQRDRSTLTQLTAIVLCAVISGGTIPAGAAVPSASRVPSYDGETMFRGLYFGTGPATGLFSEIWESKPELLRGGAVSPEFSALQDRILGRIRTGDPTFFQRFEAGLRSGNHIRVERTLSEGSRAITGDPEVQGMGKDPQLPPPFVILVVVVAVLAIILIVDDGGPAHSSPGMTAMHNLEPLEKDVFVDVIARRLAYPETASR